MARTILPQIGDNVPRVLRLHRHYVAADCENLVTASAAGLLEGVLVVVDGLSTWVAKKDEVLEVS
jgi:hypothetical protein